jgi:hypothetical protein
MGRMCSTDLTGRDQTSPAQAHGMQGRTYLSHISHLLPSASWTCGAVCALAARRGVGPEGLGMDVMGLIAGFTSSMGLRGLDGADWLAQLL